MAIKKSGSFSGDIDRVFSDSDINAEIGLKPDVTTPSMPVSKCNIDKPMHPTISDKRWMPPKNKE